MLRAATTRLHEEVPWSPLQAGLRCPSCLQIRQTLVTGAVTRCELPPVSLRFCQGSRRYTMLQSSFAVVQTFQRRTWRMPMCVGVACCKCRERNGLDTAADGVMGSTHMRSRAALSWTNSSLSADTGRSSKAAKRPPFGGARGTASPGPNASSLPHPPTSWMTAPVRGRAAVALRRHCAHTHCCSFTHRVGSQPPSRQHMAHVSTMSPSQVYSLALPAAGERTCRMRRRQKSSSSPPQPQ